MCSKNNGMTFLQLIKHFGTQLQAAKAIGCSQPTLSNWKARGRIPLLQQMRIELITEGKLKAQPLLVGKKRPNTIRSVK